MAHNIKPGVATGDQVQEIFRFAKEKGFALPAINVTNSSNINGVMETAAKLNAPVIIQFSNGGGLFMAGKGLSNENEKAAIAGCVSGAKHVHELAELYQWVDSPIIAGQDLQSGGTWMGVTASGRWAVITNFRDGHDQRQYPTSRGQIIQQFLESDLTPIRFAQAFEKTQCDYAGFNLIVGDLSQAVYMSNRGEPPQVLAHGVYVLSNGLMRL